MRLTISFSIPFFDTCSDITVIEKVDIGSEFECKIRIQNNATEANTLYDI